MTTEVPEEAIAAALRRLAEGPDDGDVGIAELGELLGVRSFGIAMLLLAAPNLTPGPSLPGFSTIFGLPMIWLAVEMLLGRGSPRLPRFLAERRIGRLRLRAFLARALPLIERVDRVVRPRWRRVARSRRLAACGLLGQGILLALPLPLVSMAAALAALLIAVGLLAHDGIAIVAGQLAGLGAFVLYAMAIWVAHAAFGWA